MKVAAWNINSLRVRMDRVLAWLEANQPDALCLQETKVEDKDFPALSFQSAGYRSAFHGQKTYNGVAILTKEPLRDVREGMGDGADDPQARLIAGTLNGVRIISAYMPNGEAFGTAKYEYKLKWLARLRTYFDTHHKPDEKIALCGDYNVAPDDRDVCDVAAWADSTLCHPQTREALKHIAAFGLTDSYRLHEQPEKKFSWWDYRQLAFVKNQGLRIDHIFVTQPLAAVCTSSVIDREARKGQQPSDHAPVIAQFSLG